MEIHLQFKSIFFQITLLIVPILLLICKNNRNDSIVSDRINFDLMKKVQEIQEGTRSCYKLYGSLKTNEANDGFLENRYHGN